MGDSDFLYRKVGAVEYPTPASAVEDGQLFSVFDPVRDRLLDLFKTAINAELSPAWNVARVGTSLAAKDPVESTYHDHVYLPLAREVTFDFPLLSLYRASWELEEWSLAINSRKTEWQLEYVLPPLSPKDSRRLLGIREAIDGLVRQVIRRNGGSHPSYQDGAPQFSEVGISSIDASRGSVGHWAIGPQGENGAAYPVLVITLMTVELDGFVEGEATPYRGAMIHIGVGNGDGEILPDVVVADTAIRGIVGGGPSHLLDDGGSNILTDGAGNQLING